MGRSQDLLRAMTGEPFDLVYIDASHEAADVLADAVLAWPLLKPGGFLGFDDYTSRRFPEPEQYGAGDRRVPGRAASALRGTLSRAPGVGAANTVSVERATRQEDALGGMLHQADRKWV